MQLNKMTYDDIQNSEYCDEIDAFNNQTIRTVVVKNWPSVEVLYLLFLRLNTGSVKLSPQELRQALYPGKFIDYVNSVSSTCDELKKMLNIKKPDFRMRDVEILIRYFSFAMFAKDYSGSMQQFLDNSCNKLNKTWDNRHLEIEDFYNRFQMAVQKTYDIFGNNAFHKFKANDYETKTNRAVADIMLFYFSDPGVQAGIPGHEKQIKLKFEELSTNRVDFLSSIETTTKSMQSVTERFNTWAEALSEELGMKVQSPYSEN